MIIGKSVAQPDVIDIVCKPVGGEESKQDILDLFHRHTIDGCYLRSFFQYGIISVEVSSHNHCVFPSFQIERK